MKEQKYVDLVDELNNQLVDNKYFDDLGMNFSYTTNGYVDIINFGEFLIYCSENDCLSKLDLYTEEFVDISLKEFVIQKFNELKNELFQIELK